MRLFLLARRDGCMCCACWQTSFTVYKYHSTCSLLQWNKSGLPAADAAQFHQIIATGKRALCVLIHLAFTTVELFHKMYTHTRGWQIHLARKLSSNKATQCCRDQMFCSLIFFFNAMESLCTHTHMQLLLLFVFLIKKGRPHEVFVEYTWSICISSQPWPYCFLLFQPQDTEAERGEVASPSAFREKQQVWDASRRYSDSRSTTFSHLHIHCISVMFSVFVKHL